MSTKQIILLAAAATAVAGGIGLYSMKLGLTLGAGGIVVAYLLPPVGFPSS